LPHARTLAPPMAAQLAAATAAAARAGRPVRIALIATRQDLGAVPSLFGHPAAYARFLGSELQFVYRGRLLVVMPQGAALSQKGRLVRDRRVAQLRVRRGAD